MTFPTVPWAMALIFISGLIMIARLRTLMVSISRSSYNNLSWGLVILALFSLGKVYHGLGMMASVPFVSEATFFQLIWGIGMISGTIFVLSGASEFTPLSRKHRQVDQARINRMELIQIIEQLIGVESRLDQLLERTLAHIVTTFKFDQGAVFKYSSRFDRTVLVAVDGEAETLWDQLARVRFSLKNWTGWANPVGQDENLVENLPAELDQPYTLTPIRAGLEPVGFFICWGGTISPVDREKHQILKLVAEIISRKIASDRIQLKSQFLNRGETMRRRLSTTGSADHTLKEALTRAGEIIAEELPHEMLCLTILDGPGGAHRRLTVGSNGAFLDERGLAPSNRRAITNAVLTNGEPLIIEDYDPHNTLIGEDILDSGAICSALCVPVVDDHRIVATMIIAHSQPNLYRNREAALLSYSTPGVAQIIRDEFYRTTVLTREKRIARLTNFVKEAQEADSFGLVSQMAADLISQELSASQVRVSLVEDHGQFLKSYGLAAQREVSSNVPADGRMILSIMPCHQLVLKSGRQLIVNQTCPDSARMPESETSQALNHRLSSALIVPIKKGERVIGMISIAEMRHWQRFQFEQADILFTEALAEILTLAHAASTDTGYSLPTDHSRVSPGVIVDLEARSRVRSSLTGILGSIEMLKGSGASKPETVNRYLEIIDSSARKINEYLSEPTPTG